MVRRGVVDRAIEAAAEAVVLDDLSETFVPLMVEALGGSGSLLFDFGANGRPRAVSGSLAPHIAAYNESLFGKDPLQGALRRIDPAASTVMLEDAMAYDEIRASPAFQEFYRPLGVERLIGVWPTGKRFGSEGMVGLMIGRPMTARAFNVRERGVLARIKPVLCAVIARDRRSKAHERERELMAEVLRHAAPRLLLVVDARGEIAWRSGRVCAWERATPDAATRMHKLLQAARALLRQPRPRSVATCEATLWPTEVQGRRAVVVEIRDDAATDADVFATGCRLGLTRAEASVLVHVARGLDNRSIAGALHVSEPTVKTHVRQILAKLGLANRTQAALLVHGTLPPRA